MSRRVHRPQVIIGAATFDVLEFAAFNGVEQLSSEG
jgi:hypothetical protein